MNRKRGESMDAKIKKLTIYISSSMGLELDVAKKECYREGTQNDMIRDLIVRGLASLGVRTEQTKKVY